MKRTLWMLAAVGVAGWLVAGTPTGGTTRQTSTKPGFAKTTYEAWVAKEIGPEKELRAALAKLEGRIVFSAGLGVKEGKAYQPVREGEGNWDIYSIRPDGTDLRNLTRHPARDDYPRVSPDGARIAFTSDRDLPAGARMEYSDDEHGIGSIIVMNADGSDPKKVCDGVTPAWSIDGKRLALSRGKQVFLRDLASGKEVAQTPDNWRNAVYPDFASDGVHMIATGVTGRGYIIYGWAFDPATMERKGEVRQVSSAEGCNAELTPDGKAFLWVQDHGKDTFSRLYRTGIDWAQAKPQPFARIPLNQDPFWEYYPTPSPDGKYLCYSLAARGKSLGEGWTMVKEQELYVAPLAGGAEARVTFAGLTCKHPNWNGRMK